MCRAGGPRCAGHMRARLSAAQSHQADVERKIEAGLIPLYKQEQMRASAQKRVTRNQELLDQTAGGLADLRAQIAQCKDKTERAELLERLDAGEEVYERQIAAHRKEKQNADRSGNGASASGGVGGSVGPGSGDGPSGGNAVGSGSGAAYPLGGPVGRSNGGGAGEVPWVDGRGDSGGDRRRVLIGGHEITGTAMPDPPGYAVLRAVAAPTPTFCELSGAEAAQGFHDAIAVHTAANPHGGSVDAHEVTDYASMRLFATEDGKTGYAIHDGDELVSVFSAAGSGRGRALVASAVASGARRGDCYAIPSPGLPGDAEGYLPRLYRSGGLVEVARVEINYEFGPPEGAMWVSVLAVMDDPPPVREFGSDGYDDALAYRDGLLRVKGHENGDVDGGDARAQAERRQEL